MIRDFVWSGKLPDIIDKPTIKSIQIYDSIIKRYFKNKFNMDPDKVDSLSSVLVDSWQMIEHEIDEKDKLKSNVK
jgi:hypothetical protein